ncbi:extracellular solute-binding protein [Dactylosporangium sp. NBC_01737]|uniref:ABC transporter substrate-binding protein n=1 Tax=Dactylosporangium sp. NBC_01737 TaxID=2975959 RepID=UPI002E15A5FB|nr:extracellular solute-binding protein [Dactylosporangium sp. NBC_01737]
MKHLRGVLSVTLCASLFLAACGDTSDKSDAADGPVTITVNGMPAATDEYNRANFEKDVKDFEAKHPNIKIDAKEGQMDPKTFSAKLAGGQLEDVFYVYFTDPQNLIAKKQVSDITPYLGEVPAIKDVRPVLMQVFSDSKGKVYGLPSANYSLGLIYNRVLFQQAGLDPDKPPTTWADVREAAKKITALGNGITGYGDYSKSNTGGWHFTAELYSIGGDVAVKDGDTWKAGFNNAQGRQVLQQLKDMRFTDRSMAEKQALEYADLLTQMAAGKLGMFVGGTGDLPNIVNQYKGRYEDYGLGVIPDGKATLGGGDGYMFKAGLSPAKIKAGLQWLAFRKLDPDRVDADKALDKQKNQPVGIPEPNIWTGASEQKLIAANTKYANVPAANYKPFNAASAGIPLKVEPPAAQQCYAALDTAMLKVLTDPNANIDQLLKDAETQVNQILSTVK